MPELAGPMESVFAGLCILAAGLVVLWWRPLRASLPSKIVLWVPKWFLATTCAVLLAVGPTRYLLHQSSDGLGLSVIGAGLVLSLIWLAWMRPDLFNDRR